MSGVFQFPSNGKVYPKAQKHERGIYRLKFQFPSNGKVYPKVNFFLCLCFPFYLFQFPSNGKVYPKGAPGCPSPGGQGKFQFPSNGKVYPKRKSDRDGMGGTLFQFPSNGKVYPKVTVTVNIIHNGVSFNSLQTGKYIQRQLTSSN